jgi:hypothetical protein
MTDVLVIVGLWGVLNNAGIGGGMGPVEWFTLDDYKQLLKQLEIRSMERGYRPNPVWSPGAIWNWLR